MPQTGIQLVSRVRELVQDKAGVRWTNDEMLVWLNDGLLELVLLKPTAVTARRTLDLDAGTTQTLPTDVVQLLRITHNTSGKVIRLIDLDRLDAIAPTWRGETATIDVQHYMYDTEAPTEFEVYPPNTGSGRVVALMGVKVSPLLGITNLVDVDDIYYPALVNYLLYRAYSKHSKAVGNEQRAATAYTRFADTLGVKLNIESVVAPKNVATDPQTGVE